MEIADKAEWTKRLREAKAIKMRLYQFQKKWKINSSAAWSTIKRLVDDEDLTAFHKGGTYAKRGPYNKEKSEKPINYQKVELLPEPAPIQNMKPVYCVTAVFESAEAAFRAIGKLQS